jgi:hypothetical protein
VHSGASGARNVDAPLFMLGWARRGIHEKHAGKHYAELVFFHSVGSVGHVVLFAVLGARNIITLFFQLGWDRFDFHKKHTGCET